MSPRLGRRAASEGSRCLSVSELCSFVVCPTAHLRGSIQLSLQPSSRRLRPESTGRSPLRIYSEDRVLVYTLCRERGFAHPAVSELASNWKEDPTISEGSCSGDDSGRCRTVFAVAKRARRRLLHADIGYRGMFESRRDLGVSHGQSSGRVQEEDSRPKLLGVLVWAATRSAADSQDDAMKIYHAGPDQFWWERD